MATKIVTINDPVTGDAIVPAGCVDALYTKDGKKVDGVLTYKKVGTSSVDTPTVIQSIDAGTLNGKTEEQIVDQITADTAVGINLKAPTESPVFTGSPKCPTAIDGDSSELIANTEFVTNALCSKLDGYHFFKEVPATGWTTDAVGYHITLTITNITAAMVPVVSVVLSDDVATAKLQLNAWSNINRITVHDGYIVVYCYYNIPSMEIQIQLIGGI